MDGEGRRRKRKALKALPVSTARPTLFSSLFRLSVSGEGREDKDKAVTEDYMQRNEWEEGICRDVERRKEVKISAEENKIEVHDFSFGTA